jgi:S-disulfanyl-L-cysteine oxidoreductase SoxD
MRTGLVGTDSVRAQRENAFEHVRRAMLFQAPGSFTTDEICPAPAYILAEGNVIDKALVLDAQILTRVQMPNRDDFIPDPRPELFE